MASPITREQEELLIALAEADRRALATNGERDTFAWSRQGGMGPTVLIHAGLPEQPAIDQLDMESLISAGYLQQRGQRSARLTPAGMRLADELLLDRTAAEPLDLSWSTIEPLLHALWDAWLARGCPAMGVPIEELPAASLEQQVRRVMPLLADAGWVELRSPGAVGGGDGGPSYAPSARAVVAYAGWPAPEEVGQRFLAAVDAAIETASDEPTKSRLRAFREAAARVGEGTIAQLLAAIAEGRFPHF